MWKKWLTGSEKSKTGVSRQEKVPRHVAIIMDGNGRWAKERGLLRTFGHRAGAETLQKIIQTASDIGIEVLTVYAFSTENWKRPEEEVGLLMRLIAEYLDSKLAAMHANQVQLRHLGDLAGLPSALQLKLTKAMEQTRNNTGLVVNLAINYGGRAEILEAVKALARAVENGEVRAAEIDEDVFAAALYTQGLPDPDLLIRTSGDVRLSNFLLWQTAYTELYFCDVNWPDFTPEHLMEAIASFQKRERRFGGLKK